MQRQYCLTHMIVPVVYSSEGSMTCPSMMGLLMRNAANDKAQTRKSEASASCDPVPHISMVG